MFIQDSRRTIQGWFSSVRHQWVKPLALLVVGALAAGHSGNVIPRSDQARVCATHGAGCSGHEFRIGEKFDPTGRTCCATGVVESGAKFSLCLPVDRQRAAAAIAAAVPQQAVFPLPQTFFLHSRPSATKVIYLDFDGHLTRNTLWNSGGNTIVTAPHSFEGDDTFSTNELLQIQEVWQRVAECFSMFDVDVTTQEPPREDLRNTGGTDTRWGIRVCIGATTPSPAPGAGGVAFLTSFNWDSDTPCFSFTDNTSTFGKFIADVTVHEVGHTLGLNHDGRITPSEVYYLGHGSGPTGWAPHMGAGYYQNLVQWSRGEYASANNQEDDLRIITTQNGFTYIPDDHANVRFSAAAVAGSGNLRAFNVNQPGNIETRGDIDWFRVDSGAGTLSVTANPGDVNTMLDVQMDLYDSNGVLLTSSNPPATLNASITQTLLAGTYYLRVEGVGNGNPALTGYTDYSSIGTYRLTGTYSTAPNPSNVIAAYNAATKTLTLTGDANGNVVNVRYSAGRITIEGAGGTKINNLTSTSFSHTGQLVIAGDLKGGNDSVSLIGVDSSTTDLVLGDGNDRVSVSLSRIGLLKVNGGPGVDSVVTTSSTITTRTFTSVP